MSIYVTAKPSLPRIAEEDWLHLLDALALRSSTAQPAEQRECLADLAQLLSFAPRQAALAGIEVPGEAQLEAMIAASACASAALAFLSAETGYLISRSAAGHHLASLAMPGRSDEVTAGGRSAALAIIGALCLALFDTNADILAGSMPSGAAGQIFP